MRDVRFIDKTTKQPALEAEADGVDRVVATGNEGLAFGAQPECPKVSGLDTSADSAGWPCQSSTELQYRTNFGRAWGPTTGVIFRWSTQMITKSRIV